MKREFGCTEAMTSKKKTAHQNCAEFVKTVEHAASVVEEECLVYEHNGRSLQK